MAGASTPSRSEARRRTPRRRSPRASTWADLRFYVSDGLLLVRPSKGTVWEPPLAMPHRLDRRTTMDEQCRKQQNKEMLVRIDKTIRPGVAAVISDLERQGQRPLIDKGVWRSPAEQ